MAKRHNQPGRNVHFSHRLTHYQSRVGGRDTGQKHAPTCTLTHLEKVNDGLVRLDLSYNEISSRGVLVIAQALEENDRLEVLRLDGNK